MFYVIYSPEKKAYLNEDGVWTTFANAEKFSADDKDTLKNWRVRFYPEARFVGPCEEGVEP